MNVSYRWLQDCCAESIGSLDEVADRLAARGCPVEDSRPLSVGLEDVVVAKVRSVRPHPDADRLRVCDVDGGDGTVQVVCGAPNVEAGGRYPFAPVGASLPGGGRIRRVKIRGQASEGMLCSERELGLGNDEEGLMVLQGGYEPGHALVDALGLADVRLAVEVTPNRPDLLSHLGVARELSPGGQRSLVIPEIPGGSTGASDGNGELEVVNDPVEVSANGVTIRIEDPGLCRRYLGLRIGGVKVGPSPPWLQARLLAIGARPINNVVDATNYVLQECGQPLHAFDLKRLGNQTVVVRRTRTGESLRTLDRVERALTEDVLAICDAREPVALAGIMGGADSEVSVETTDVLLECAWFEPGSIRATRRSLGLSTDASYRFERGIDPEGMEAAIQRAGELILATAGGRIVGPLLDVCPGPFLRGTVPLRLSRIEKLLGVRFEVGAVRSLLEPLGLVIRGEEEGGDGKRLLVEVPGYRSHDISREVDLIEEVARTHGYDAFSDTLGAFRPGSVPDHPLFGLETRVRAEMVASGLLEAQVPAFAAEGGGEVEILNPVSAEEAFLRDRLLPGLTSRLQYNLRRGNRDVRLFEVGTIFRRGGTKGLPVEETRVAAVLHGRRAPAHWTKGSSAQELLDSWDLKGLLERLTSVVSGDSWRVDPWVGGGEDAVGFAPTAMFRVVDGQGHEKGVGGRIEQTRLDMPAWVGDVWGLELTLPREPDSPTVPTFRSLLVHQGTDRDLALLVPVGIPVASVLSLIRANGGQDLREVEVFDVYRGPELPGDVRSVAVRLRFQAEDRTLKDEEVEGAVRAVTRTLEEELRVGIRGSQA